MFDTLTMTKAVGALCTMLLILLLGNWAADGLYRVAGEEQAYVIDTGEADVTEEVVEEVSFETVFASADAGAGERLWRQCQACHRLDGTDGTGPHLDGVVGREIAAVDGFGYSDALSGLEGTWTPEEISAFIENPRAYAPGTSMSYSGLADIEDRADLIAYLATTDG